MKIFTYSYRFFVAMILLLNFCVGAHGQRDSSLVKRVLPDTAKIKLNMDAVYNRPFLTVGKIPVAIGGYLEANCEYKATDGVSDGFSFQFRRFTLFVSSTIAKRIKLLAEIEFEDGTKEINIEYAAMDIEFHPLVNLRGGIVLNPIGAFNQNHDGPRWDFINRPISSTTILPATLSNAGFGLHGKHFGHNWIFGYELYVSNGFNDKVISNDENRTSLTAGKSDPKKFEKSNSGLPMFSGKLAVRNRNIGELGISYITGVFNKWKVDGLVLDKKRSVSAVAVDFNTSLLKNRFNIVAEVANVFVDVPSTYSQNFGTHQLGGFIDLTGTVMQRKVLGWEKAKLNLCVRVEYADYNVGKFAETGGSIADNVWAVVPGIAFRPAGTTVLRLNYRYEQRRDILGNPPEATGAVQFGFSTYF